MSQAEREADRIEAAEVHANAVQEENDRLHRLVDEWRQGDGHTVCRAELAKANQDGDQVWALLHGARQSTRRLTAILIANASRLDVPFTNAEGSPWSRHVKPAIERLQTALGMRGEWPSAGERWPRPFRVTYPNGDRYDGALFPSGRCVLDGPDIGIVTAVSAFEHLDLSAAVVEWADGGEAPTRRALTGEQTEGA